MSVDVLPARMKLVNCFILVLSLSLAQEEPFIFLDYSNLPENATEEANSKNNTNTTTTTPTRSTNEADDSGNEPPTRSSGGPKGYSSSSLQQSSGNQSIRGRNLSLFGEDSLGNGGQRVLSKFQTQFS